MSIRKFVVVGLVLAVVGCGKEKEKSPAEIKAETDKMMSTMPALPAKLENPNDPMKTMTGPGPGTTK